MTNNADAIDQSPDQSTDTATSGDVTAKLVILTINDVYDLFPDSQGVGGIAEFATLLAQEKAKVPSDATLIVTLNGDFLSGSELSQYTQGSHMIDLLNTLEIDYVVIGNHECDFGRELLEKQVAASQFTWLGGNVRDAESDELLPQVRDSLILPVGSLQLGVFGVCTEETPTLSYPGESIVFKDAIESSKESISKLQEQGADCIVGITHLSIDTDQKLARATGGAISAIVGGHDHDPFTLYEGHTFIHKSGQNAFWLGKIQMDICKKENGQVSTSIGWEMILNKGYAPDPHVYDVLMKYVKEMQEKKEKEENSEEDGRVVATLATPLSTKTNALRTGSCNSGDFVADALRNELHAEVGVINGGFIRGDSTYPAKTQLTLAMLKQEMPFPRCCVLIEMKVSDLKQALKQHARHYPRPSGGYPHVSGIQVTLQNDVITMLDEAGEEMEDERVIKVATTQFVTKGGDGCDAWMNGKVLETTDTRVADAVADYAMKQRLIRYPEDSGRFRILE